MPTFDKKQGRIVMKKLLTTLMICLSITMLTHTAAAAVFGDGGAALQAALDSVTVDPLGNSSVDVVNDAMSDQDDSYWSVSSSGSSIHTLVIELAAFQQSGNTFGLYEISDPSNKVELFNSAEVLGTKVVTILNNFDVYVNYAPTGINLGMNGFGYYLDTQRGDTWFSNTAMNTDGADHMTAYQGNDTDIMQLGIFAPGLFQSSEYILAFEEQSISDVALGNYDDFVVLVESVTPIPEPATMGLLALGGLIIRRRKSA